MSKPVIIIGAGGHAKVLIDCLQLLGIEVLGALDKNLNKDTILQVPVLGDDVMISEYPTKDVELVNGIGSVGNMNLRASVFIKYKKLGYDFRTVIHPSAVIARNCILGEGVQIMAGAIINTDTKINENVIVNTGSVIDHECVIGKHVHIAPGCTLSGNVRVGDKVHVGTGSKIIQGVVVGSNSLIGAGAVVVNEVLSGTKVIGIPARLY